MSDTTSRRQEAAQQLNERAARNDGAKIVSELSDGMTLLRDLLYLRIHRDVENTFGMDSMLVPLSEEKTALKTKAEIEVYQIAVSTVEVQQRGYLKDVAWFQHWLTGLRLGQTAENPKVNSRVEQFVAMEYSQRRLAFEKSWAA